MTAITAGLCGAHISATRLPAALQAMSREAGVALSFDLIDSGDDPRFVFEETVAHVRQQGWTGLTVTHPFKIAALELAETVAPDVPAGMGASNLLLFKDGGLTAHNTDYSGFLGAWEERWGSGKPGKVAMAGAGGVARAVGFALAQLGAADIAIWDLDEGRALQLAADIGIPARAVKIADAADVCRKADGLVNATALGMAKYPGMAFQKTDVGGQAWAFDAVYTPVRTQFLQAAEAGGLETLSGFDLFRHMAMASFETYSGMPLDKQAWRTKLEILRP